MMIASDLIAPSISRAIARSQLGFGFATIRDDELAAEASGVPTLRLKLIATTLSGALMGMAGAPFPYYIGYFQPASAFGLEYARQFHRHADHRRNDQLGRAADRCDPAWLAQQIATVTISSAVNLLIVGLLLVGFVVIAPNGLVGLVQERLRRGGAMTALLHVNNISKRFGGFVALDGISSRSNRASGSD